MAEAEYDYLAIVQCDIVMERCSGFYCERALHQRSGGFAGLAGRPTPRYLMLTCGGCCGRGLQRKLIHLRNQLGKRDGIAAERLAVRFATCITKESHHGPACPHLDYLRTLVQRLDLRLDEDTHIVDVSAKLREAGVYEPGS